MKRMDEYSKEFENFGRLTHEGFKKPEANILMGIYTLLKEQNALLEKLTEHKEATPQKTVAKPKAPATAKK